MMYRSALKLRPRHGIRDLAFSTLSKVSGSRLLNENGVDIKYQAGWKLTSGPSSPASKFSPHFRLRIDREVKALVFDIYELVGPSKQDAQDPEADLTSLKNGKRHTFPLRYSDPVLPEALIESVNRSLRFLTTPTQQLQLKFSLDSLWRSFKKYEAEEIHFRIQNHFDDIRFSLETMTIDTDSLARQPDLQAIPKKDDRTQLERVADEKGLIYTELEGDIGCIVNGAGLAMATDDILTTFGGKAANFLDTGGQATTDLLVKAFELLLLDSRVKAILVNIFGGVIRCDMIAESILRAAKELDLQSLPIVVRLKGTNQEIGQKMIAESGLQLFAADQIDEAAKQVVTLARERGKRQPARTSVDLRSNPTRQYSTSSRVENLTRLSKFDIDSTTRLIYQGFTGTVATSNARATIAFGTNVVGGVSPGKGGTSHLDLPVFNTVKEAMTHVQPDATAIFVPALKAKSAILEAIEAEVPLIVCIAEGIPMHDMLQIHEALKDSPKSKLIGPNCPGIINPSGKVRIGIMPYQQFSPGCIGIISKSGTLSYEAVGETTKHGLGQSLVLGIGGDMLPGTSMVDALAAMLPRQDTRGIILIGEIGGTMEIEAAKWIKANNVDGKPIVGLVAGHTAPVDRVMGHAGALRRQGDLTAEQKCAALEEAGVVVVEHTGLLGLKMKELLHH